VEEVSRRDAKTQRFKRISISSGEELIAMGIAEVFGSFDGGVAAIEQRVTGRNSRRSIE
jgi:hypothetical protein